MTSQPASDDTSNANEKIEVLYGAENIVNRTLQDLVNVKKTFDNCTDYTGPSVFLAYQPMWDACITLKQKGVRLRFITEITKDNISYCKEAMKVFDLRHLDGVKDNFGIADGKDYGGAANVEEGDVPTQLIRSNVKAFVEQQQYFFETLWTKATPAEQRIREIEEGIIPLKSKIVEDENEIIKEIRRLNNSACRLSVCSAFGGMQMSYNYFFDTYKKIVKGERMRWIINIDKKYSLDLIKVFLNAGIQVRHIKNMPPMNFGVSDKELAATVEKMEGGKMSQSFLISNEPLYVDHFNSIFEELWNKGIDATDRVRDIEEGTDLADIEIIQNSREGMERAWNYVRKSKHEILSIFSTANAFRRQMRHGLLQLLNEATEQRSVQVRILIPADEQIKDTIDQAAIICPQVDFRVAEENLQTRITIVIIDKKDCMIIELRDDTKDSSYSAAGLTTYSNSNSIISSYVSIFESLWKQNELYEQLKIHDRMQQEFINVAAHELRTPIQPILGLAEVLRSKLRHGKQEKEYLDVIIRNAKRLQRLAEDILDITRIESKSLDLKKEIFNLTQTIFDAIADSENQIAKENKYRNLKLELVNSRQEDILIEADKGRISQVISNLLSNAIKFTNEGIISVAAEKKDHEVLVSIKDNGAGIDAEILPRLFTKFATKSVTGGTGLGLFISKSIIEAHGGRILAENNNRIVAWQKGATFYFTLPMANNQHNHQNLETLCQ
jgi:two-component system sensor histidine kinase VicK